MRRWDYLLDIAFVVGSLSTALGQSENRSDSGLSRPQLLDAKSACQLISQDEVSTRVIYSIPGTYISDGHHFTQIEVEGCDQIVNTELGEEAYVKINQYHNALHEKCGGYWMGDHFSGVFTGKFVRRKTQLLGTSEMIDDFHFVISKIDTKELDFSTCPKVYGRDH